MKLTNAIGLVVLLFTACQFNPDDVYFVDLQEPEAPEVKIIELTLSQDTIFLADYKNIQFNFSAGGYKVTQVNVLIDGEEKYTRSNYKDSFTILPSDISEGVHKLSFSVITNSNTGSIADLLGYEGFQFISNEWTLICVKNDRMSDYVTQEVKNGKLEISWESHDKVNFKSYRITKRYHFSDGIAKEYHTTKPYFVDEAYVGEKAYYDIYTEYYSSGGYEFHWGETVVENSLPEIKIRNNSDGNFEVYWDDNDFVAAIKNYRLVELPTPSDTITLAENPPGENNRFAIPNGVFGRSINYKLVVIPNNPDTPFNNDAVYYHSTSYDGLVGEKSFSYERIASVDASEMLVLKNNFIYRYSIDEKEALDSLTYNWDNCGIAYSGFSISPQGKFFTTYETCNYKVVLMNPGNLKNYQSYPIAHILTEGMHFNSLPVSDNGIVIAKDYGGIFIYNVLNDKLIDSYALNDAVYATGISSNGDYFYVKTHQLCFYKIVDDAIQDVWKSNPFYDYVYTMQMFDSQNPENIILYDGQTLYHKNASDFSTTKSFNLGEEQILNVDLSTRKLLAYTDGYLSVYNIDTGEQVVKIMSDTKVVMTQYHCKLVGNTIYLGDGVCYNLPKS